MDKSFRDWLWLNEVRVIFGHSKVPGATWKQFEPHALRALETGRWDEGKIGDFLRGDSLLARLGRAGVEASTLLDIMHHDPALAPVLHAPMAMVQSLIGGHHGGEEGAEGGFASKVAGGFADPHGSPDPHVRRPHALPHHDDHDHNDIPHQEHPPGSKEETEKSHGNIGKGKPPVGPGPGPDPEGEGGFGSKVAGGFDKPGRSMWSPMLDKLRQSRDDAAARLAMDVENGGRRRGYRPPPPPPPNPWWKNKDKEDEDDEDEVSDW